MRGLQDLLSPEYGWTKSYGPNEPELQCVDVARVDVSPELATEYTTVFEPPESDQRVFHNKPSIWRNFLWSAGFSDDLLPLALAEPIIDELKSELEKKFGTLIDYFKKAKEVKYGYLNLRK